MIYYSGIFAGFTHPDIEDIAMVPPSLPRPLSRPPSPLPSTPLSLSTPPLPSTIPSPFHPPLSLPTPPSPFHPASPFHPPLPWPALPSTALPRPGWLLPRLPPQVRIWLFSLPELPRDDSSALRVHMCAEVPDQIEQMRLSETSEWGLSELVGQSKVRAPP